MSLMEKSDRQLPVLVKPKGQDMKGTYGQSNSGATVVGDTKIMILDEVMDRASTDGHDEADDDKSAIEEAVRSILTHVGEDPEREGMERTPHRVAKSYAEILAGYKMNPVTVINGALFDVEYDEMIVVKDIEFFSMCEHHMLPFFGKAHVAYIPGEKVIGLSKIPRIVEMFARRLQVQETDNHADSGSDRGDFGATGRRRGCRRIPYVFGYARGEERTRAHGYQHHVGLLQEKRQDAKRIHGAPSPAP